MKVLGVILCNIQKGNCRGTIVLAHYDQFNIICFQLNFLCITAHNGYEDIIAKGYIEAGSDVVCEFFA
jgi:hypothetical protein